MDQWHLHAKTVFLGVGPKGPGSCGIVLSALDLDGNPPGGALASAATIVR